MRFPLVSTAAFVVGLVACVQSNAPPAPVPSHVAHGLWAAEQSSSDAVLEAGLDAHARSDGFGERRLDRQREQLDRQRSEERLRRDLHIRDHDSRSPYGGR